MGATKLNQASDLIKEIAENEPFDLQMICPVTYGNMYGQEDSPEAAAARVQKVSRKTLR